MRKLFIDKYTPNTFDDVKFNYKIAEHLKIFSKQDNIPHLIIKGPKSSGKKTFALLYVKNKYNKKNILIRKQKRQIKYSSKTIEFNLIYSNYHHLIDLSAYGVYDRIITQCFFKNILQIPPISECKYRIIIIENADKLTNEAQQSLRRTLEKYVDSCRFIFLVNNEASLISPLNSRCIQFRLSSPNNEELFQILNNISSIENIKIHKDRLYDIVNYSEGNIKLALHTLQFLNESNKTLLNSIKNIDFYLLYKHDMYYKRIVELIFNIDNVMSFIDIRHYVYDLLIHCIEPIDILKNIFKEIMKYLNKHNMDKKKNYIFITEIVDNLSKYENSLRKCSKPIYHIEGFIMSIINELMSIKK